MKSIHLTPAKRPTFPSLTRRIRNHEQSMGLWINEPLIAAPKEMLRSIGTLADAGYGIIRLFVRNSVHTHFSPEVIQTIEEAVSEIHRRGMRAVLDCEPHVALTRHMLQKYPSAGAVNLLCATARVVNGRWLLRAESPALAEGGSSYFDGVEAAFLREDGHCKKIELNYEIDRESHWIEDGNIHREMFYQEGIPLSCRRIFTLRGQLPGDFSGELAVYLRFGAHQLPDFWSRGFRSYFHELLKCYQHIPLDGVGWDEPAIDANWKHYRYGTAFAKAFKERNHYALVDQLYLLDEPGMTAESIRVRLDYYNTLNEGLAQAQSQLIDDARHIFGSDLILGTHHTWQGEGGIGDYRAGAVDYFRLNDNMDAGYTDCSWWDPASVAYAYTLASSLGRLTPSGEAEVNTWHYKPTVSNIRSQVNLMTLMNITWFNIWFGRDCDCVLQEGHRTWPETVKQMQSHRDFQRTIAGRRPDVNIAIWHGWEGVCGWNRPEMANAHKAFCLNTCKLLIERNLAADFIDSRLLAESTLEKGHLVNRLGRYRILIMPYAMVLPRSAYDVCVSFARQGGRVIFVGTPVVADEKGQSLTKEFSQLVGCPPMTAEAYWEGINAVCSLPDIRSQRLEICRELSPNLPRALVSAEGEVHGVVSEAGNVVFLTDLDPQQRLVEQIEKTHTSEVQAFSNNLLWRLYRNQKSDILVIVAREDRPVRGIVLWKEQQIEILSGSVGLFEMKAGNLSVTGNLRWRHLKGSSAQRPVETLPLESIS